jgi:hydrogenase nickel incorporation protein HypB
LLPHVPFQLDQARANAHTIHPDMEILEVSATTGVGLDDWMRWLASRRARFSEELQTHQESEVNYVGTRL